MECSELISKFPKLRTLNMCFYLQLMDRIAPARHQRCVLHYHSIFPRHIISDPLISFSFHSLVLQNLVIPISLCFSLFYFTYFCEVFMFNVAIFFLFNHRDTTHFDFRILIYYNEKYKFFSIFILLF